MRNELKIFLIASILLSFVTAMAQTAPDTIDVRRGALQLKSGATTNIGLKLRFFEASNQSGNNYFGIRAPRSLSANINMIWPSAAPDSGQFLYAAASDSFGWSVPADTMIVELRIDTTNTNSDNLSLLSFNAGTALVRYFPLNDADDDTVAGWMAIPDYVDSLEYLQVGFRANASSGSYRIKFDWEFLHDDDPYSNLSSYTNSASWGVSAPSASGDERTVKLYFPLGASKDAGGAGKIFYRFIRDGDGTTGTDDAGGNMDIIDVLAGWSREH